MKMHYGQKNGYKSRKQAQSVTMPKLQAWSRLCLLGYVLAACSLRKQGAGCAVRSSRLTQASLSLFCKQPTLLLYTMV
jgi:hypothetical protein